jgi:hypothetical protein
MRLRAAATLTSRLEPYKPAKGSSAQELPSDMREAACSLREMEPAWLQEGGMLTARVCQNLRGASSSALSAVQHRLGRQWQRQLQGGRGGQGRGRAGHGPSRVRTHQACMLYRM